MSVGACQDQSHPHCVWGGGGGEGRLIQLLNNDKQIHVCSQFRQTQALMNWSTTSAVAGKRALQQTICSILSHTHHIHPPHTHILTHTCTQTHIHPPPHTSYPASLLTTVSSLGPLSLTARIRFSGMPTKPNPERERTRSGFRVSHCLYTLGFNL